MERGVYDDDIVVEARVWYRPVRDEPRLVSFLNHTGLELVLKHSCLVRGCELKNLSQTGERYCDVHNYIIHDPQRVFIDKTKKKGVRIYEPEYSDDCRFDSWHSQLREVTLKELKDVCGDYYHWLRDNCNDGVRRMCDLLGVLDATHGKHAQEFSEFFSSVQDFPGM